MTRKNILLVAVILCGISFSAQAGNGYIGVSAANMNYQEPGSSIDTLGLVGRLGYRLVRFLDVEVRVGSALSDDNGTREFDLGGLAGAYVKLNIQPVSSQHFEIYLIGGMTYIDARIGNVGTATNETDSTASYGLGFDFFGTEQTAFNVEWIRYGDSQIGNANTPYTLDALSVGMVHHF